MNTSFEIPRLVQKWSAVVLTASLVLVSFAFITPAFAAPDVVIDTINGEPYTGHCIAGTLVIVVHGTRGSNGGPYGVVAGNGFSTSTEVSVGSGADGSFTDKTITYTPTGASNNLYINLFHGSQSGMDSHITVVNQCIAAPTQGAVTVKKLVVNNSGGTATSSNFTLHINGNSFAGSLGGTDFLLTAGTYPVTEDAYSSYTNTSTQCVGNNATTSSSVTVVAGKNYVCTVTNDDNAPVPNTPPTIVLNGSNPTDVTLGTAYVELGAVANDTEDGLGLIVTNITGAVNHLVVGIYHILYNFIDTGGLSAPEVDRTVNVIYGTNQCNDGVDNDGDESIDYPSDAGCSSYSDNSENEPPVITVTGDNPLELVVNVDAYSEQGATADDAEDGNGMTVTNIDSSAVNTSVVGSYQVTYNFTDLDGADAIEKTRTVNVVAGGNECNDTIDNDGDGNVDYPADSGCESLNDQTENTPPDVIIDTEIVMLTLHSVFSPPTGVHVTDVEDGTVPVIIVNNPVDVDIVGDYTMTYGATDSDGASAAEENQTVKVRAECADTFNNDGEEDSLIDADDPGCWTDPNNPDTYNPLDEDETTPADVCPNLDKIQTQLPEGYEFDEEGNCVLIPTPTDLTPPASHFGNNHNHEIIDTELLALSLTGSSTDDFPGIKSGVDSAKLKVFKIADDTVVGSSNFNEQFQQMSCDSLQEQVPIEIVALSLTSLDPLPLNTTWSHDWTPSKGVYCFEVHAKDKAGNEEHTAIAGPFAYTFTPPTPPLTLPPVHRTQGQFNHPIGQVLGASTGQVLGESCGLYMDRFIRLGSRYNDIEQVKKLQGFLNKWIGSNLPITGFYGPLTLNALNVFQEKYASEILTPWGLTGPTGIAYLTTLRQINILECPDLSLQIPTLIEWSRNPNIPHEPLAITPSSPTPSSSSILVPPNTSTSEQNVSEPVPTTQSAAVTQAVKSSGGLWAFLKGLFGK